MNNRTLNNRDRKDPAAAKIAQWLDNRFRIPGTDIRFGIDPLLGLITGAGDWAGALFSSYLMIKAVQYGAGVGILFRMFFNICLDLIIGIFPVLGDLFDIGFKANIRNLELLNEVSAHPEAAENRSRVLTGLVLMVLLAMVLSMALLVSWLFAKAIQYLF